MPRLDVQADLIARLSDALDVPVSEHVVGDHPQPCVTVTRLGGASENRLIDSPSVGVYCYHMTSKKAYDLADEVSAVMESLPFEGGYASVEMRSMRSDPDPDSRTRRWFLSYSLKTFRQ